MNLFDISNLEKQLSELEQQTMQDGFWNDSKNSSIILQKIKTLKNKVEKYNKINNELSNLIEMSDLIIEEANNSNQDAHVDENNNEMTNDILRSTKTLQNEIDDLEIETLLSGKYDINNAIVTIHPGARWNRISRLG